MRAAGRGLRIAMVAPALGRRRSPSCLRTAVFLFLVTFVWLQLHVASLGGGGRGQANELEGNDSSAAILSMVPQVLHKFLTPRARNVTLPLANASGDASRPANAVAALNVSEIKRNIARYNEMQTVINEDVFGPLQNDTLVIVVQVHTRITYLRHLIVSLAVARDIDSVLLVFSHDHYDEEINDLVQSVDFCKVMQVFYPHSIQTHQHEFPGESPGDCPRNVKREQAELMKCNNALYPDLYGHYREAKFTQTKHHWWWKANRVFNQLEVTRNHVGMVLFLEEDHFVAEDFIHILRLMERTCTVSCKKCNILSLGTYLKTYSYYGDSKKAEVTPWVSSKHNMGMAFNRSTWQEIRRCGDFFCRYDDYNWDWSLQHISQGCMTNKLYAMVMKGPRVFHIGECHVQLNSNDIQSEEIVGKTSLPSSPVQTGLDVSAEESVLQRFYNGTSVFITGATGFMGKVLVEKLLRSCPNIERIYLLVRVKKGKHIEERIDDLVSNACFDRLRASGVDPRAKLTGVGGDVSVVGLGIDDADAQQLAQSVGVVFHFAATVRFDAKLRAAILQNVRGTRDLLALCRTFDKLKALIHVSTAYSNCPSKTIEERFYEAPMTSELAIQMAEGFDEETMQRLAPGLLGEWPNTYAYTKLISEEACERYGKGLPLGVVRPSIVVCTAVEPAPGWIDNMYGPTGVFVGVVAGLLRTMHTDGRADANLVPCDMAVNGIVAAAWDVAERRGNDAVCTPVYNYISPSCNRVTWGTIANYYLEALPKCPSNNAIWHPFLFYTSNKISTTISRFFLHFLPAYMIDLLLLTIGKKTMMVATYRKIHKFLEVMTYFSTQQWTFLDDNVLGLWDKLDATDQQLFHFNMRDLNWKLYITNTLPGIRRYLLKEDDATIPLATERSSRLRLLHWVTMLFIGLLFVWFLWSKLVCLVY